MDNALFYHSDRIRQLYSDTGVKLLYLRPYSPDFNPIDEFFAELKAHIKKYWSTFKEHCDQGFHAFLRRCVQDIGAMKKSAEGHFRHAGITVEEHEWLTYLYRTSQNWRNRRHSLSDSLAPSPSNTGPCYDQVQNIIIPVSGFIFSFTFVASSRTCISYPGS